MSLNASQYERLPGVGRAIVDLDRIIGGALEQRVMPLQEARRVRGMIRERDDLVRSADKTYGCKVGDRDGTKRS